MGGVGVEARGQTAAVSSTQRVRGAMWEGPPPPSRKRAGDLNFHRGSQALPDGEMVISGTTQGDLVGHGAAAFAARSAGHERTMHRGSDALPGGDMLIEGTTQGDLFHCAG